MMTALDKPWLPSQQLPWHLPAGLGFIHLLNDLTAGMIIGRSVNLYKPDELSLMVLIYNVLAFGTQPIAGLIADKYKLSRLFVYTGILCGITTIVIFNSSPWIAVIISGIGSSVFHVGGGSLAISADDEKASYIGLFSSPGVMGLAVGGYMAYLGMFPVFTLLSLFTVSALVVSLLKNNGTALLQNRGGVYIPDKHDLIMIAILLAIAFRSAAWNIFQYIAAGDFALLLPLALSAGLGKMSGGYLADWFGKRVWLYISLLLAIILLTFSEHSKISLFAGVFFLQASFPAAIRMLATALPGRTALTAGLAFGFAIALGALPHYLSLTEFLIENRLIVLVFVLLSLVLLIWSLRRLVESSMLTNPKSGIQ